MDYRLKKAYEQVTNLSLIETEKYNSTNLQEAYNLVLEKVVESPLDYEYRVYKTIAMSKVPGLNPGTNPGAGFSNVGSGDIQATYNNQSFNVEIKQSADTQMGGTSLRYDYTTKKFEPVSMIDSENLEIILSVISNKTDQIDKYIEAARKLPPTQFHKKIQGIPLKISKQARDFLKREGYLAAINTSIETSTDFIIQHYNKKGVFYIQIGGKGLFYLGKNPLKLPIPELEGKMKIEIRLGFSGGGSPFPSTPPIPARSANLRAQGRLITKSVSPFSLDNINQIRELFKNK